MVAATKTKKATFESRKGFMCSTGNHVLYCPDLSKADNSQPFFLYCSKHNLMYRDRSSNSGREFYRRISERLQSYLNAKLSLIIFPDPPQFFLHRSSAAALQGASQDKNLCALASSGRTWG